jgi:hypothetical protein
MSISKFSRDIVASLTPTIVTHGGNRIKVDSHSTTIGGIFLCLLLSACGGSGAGKTSAPEPTTLSGRTSFTSPATAPLIGNARNYDPINRSSDTMQTAMDTTTSTAASSTRTVTEGDIYRVLDAGKTLLNLNPYRGLQIIDLSNPTAPKILGRVAITGTPTEMYRIGERVYVLMNSWSEYRSVQKEGKEVLDRFHGAALITVDISNRSQPKIIASTPVDGYLSASRMSSGGGKSALYVAVQHYNATGSDSSVKSFAVDAQGVLQPRTSLNLGNYVQAIQALNERLMVASIDSVAALAGNWRSRVSVIDISSPDGAMVKGADVPLFGVVKQKNNMHIQGNIMRVVSSAGGVGSGFLITNGELKSDPNVVATTLGGVTSSSSTTTALATSTQVSNLNTNHVETFNIADLAKPVAIDHDTFGAGQQLFGTTFMADRAFFVTYLRQDPFHAFSITPSGVMQEENEFIVSGWNDFFVPVQADTRLIGVGHNDVNNQRTLAISLYDITNLKNTSPLLARAEIDLTNSWSEANWDDRAFTVLDNATNVLAADGKTKETGLVLLPFTGWDGSSNTYRSGVQIFSFSATTLTRRGSMQQDTQVRRSFMGDHNDNIAANLSSNELSLFSISDLNTPAKKSNLTLAANYSQFIALSNVGVRYRASDFGWWGSNSAAQRKDVIEIVALNDVDGNVPIASVTVPAGSKMFAIDNYLSLVSSEMRGSGMRTTIMTYDLSIPTNPRLTSSFVSDDILAANDYSIFQMADCGILLCGRYNYATTQVTAVGKTLVFTSRNVQNALSTDGKNSKRYWSSHIFQVVNLEDASHPVLLPKIIMDKDEESIDLIQNGSSLWINYQKAQPQLGPNGESQSKYFVKELRLASATNPQLGKEINIPGQLMAIVGNQFYSVEYALVGKNLEPSLHMSIVQNNLAYLQASVNLTGKYLSRILADENAVVLTSYDITNYQYKMDIYAAPVKDFVLQSSNLLENGTNPLVLRSGKLLAQDWYGLFLYDISQPKTPKVRAYFPAIGWGGNISIMNKDIYLPANFYGVYQFNFDTVNVPGS